MNKTNLQDNALKELKDKNHIIIEWATGLGKSLLAIKLLESKGGNWNIVLAETTHKNNWIEEFKKHGKEHLLNRINFFCYPSLKKNLDGENYIFDEVHRLYSDLRISWLIQCINNNLKNFIGLSATLSRSQKDTIKRLLNPTFNKIGLSEAIELEVLPEPTVYFIGVELDTVNKKYLFQFNKDEQVYCTAKEYYDFISKRIDFLKSRYFESSSEFNKLAWLRTANERKKFLGNYKTIAAKRLLVILRDKRLICFTTDIKQSELISNGLSIHSKKSKKTIEKLISDFNEGETNKIFATGMLKEGVNLNNIQAGIIIQLDNVERYFTQINGRVLRSKYPEQYVLYVKNTQDEVYVKTALENFNLDYVKFITLNELGYV